jgi:hypothetical protein
MSFGSGLKTERRVIGDLEITVTQLPPLRALALQCRLMKVLGPALSALEGSLESLIERDVSALGPVISAVFSRLDGREAQDLAREILCSAAATMDNRIVTLDRAEAIDGVFAGRMKAFYGAIKFALEVNFADFFDSAPAASQESDGRTTTAASSLPSTLTSKKGGRSGGSGSKASSR